MRRRGLEYRLVGDDAGRGHSHKGGLCSSNAIPPARASRRCGPSGKRQAWDADEAHDGAEFGIAGFPKRRIQALAVQAGGLRDLERRPEVRNLTVFSVEIIGCIEWGGLRHLRQHLSRLISCPRAPSSPPHKRITLCDANPLGRVVCGRRSRATFAVDAGSRYWPQAGRFSAFSLLEYDIADKNVGVHCRRRPGLRSRVGVRSGPDVGDAGRHAALPGLSVDSQSDESGRSDARAGTLLPNYREEQGGGDPLSDSDRWRVAPAALGRS